MTTYTQHEIGKCNPKLQEWEYADLQRDILSAKEVREPIVIYEGKILDGWHRYNIAVSSSLDFKTEIYTGNSPASFVKSTTTGRNLTQAQRSAILDVLNPWLESELLRNQKQSMPMDGKKGFQKVKGSLRGQEMETGISHQVRSQTAKIQRDNPELHKRILNGEVSLADIRKQEKIAKRKETIADIRRKIAAENLVMDKELYDVVAIDPPWDYTEKDMQSCDDYNPDFNRKVMPYPAMKLDSISNIKLPLKDNAVVFLWTTHAFLHDAFHLLEQWQLNYKATIVWDKEKMGIGQNIRKQCEFCLLATKGKPLIEGSSTRDIIREARRQHSRKPEAFYKLVEDITTGKRLDYFSREQRQGWDSYGIETDKF